VPAEVLEPVAKRLAEGVHREDLALAEYVARRLLSGNAPRLVALACGVLYYVFLMRLDSGESTPTGMSSFEAKKLAEGFDEMVKDLATQRATKSAVLFRLGVL
jgi:hypothetical protein